MSDFDVTFDFYPDLLGPKIKIAAFKNGKTDPEEKKIASYQIRGFFDC